MDVESIVATGVDRGTAEGLSRALAVVVARHVDPLERWRQVAAELLGPGLPFELHRLVHAHVFAGWPAARGPAPVWLPGPRELTDSNLARALKDLGAADYPALHRLSLAEPERYWGYLFAQLKLRPDAPPERMLDRGAGAEHARWLVHMRVNIAKSALERPGQAERTAVIFRSEGGPLERRSLAELAADSERVARGLAGMGLGPGDAVAIDLPMTYESVAIYLGIVRRGGVVVSIADSFAPAEIATRLRIGAAKAVFTQDVIARGGKELPLYRRVIEALAEPASAARPRIIVLPAARELSLPLEPSDSSWEQFLAGGAAQGRQAADYHSGDAERTSNILFSSGTTGDPKAIPWSHVTPIKAAADGYAHHDIREGDVVCWPTNLGWMMGPWLIYASLLNDATIALHQGSPLGRELGEFVRDARVTMLGVVPSLVKAWRGSGVHDGLDWSAIRCFSSTGEASTPHEMHWLSARAGYKPVIEYCGGTEIGGGYITGTVLQPQALSAFSTAALGCDFVILDDAGRPAESGELALVAPILGSSNRLLNRDHHEVYFEGMPAGPGGETLRRHGDQMERLGGGYFRALGRADDTMNLGGIKTSSAEIERVCNRASGVHETAAIAVSPEGGGPSLLVVYVVAAAGAAIDVAALRRELGQAIARELNPLFKIHDVVLTPSLPRTASNKVMRRVLRASYAGH